MGAIDAPELEPERRFRLYMRIHEVAKEHGAAGLAEACMEQARKAVSESPQLQEEFRVYLQALCDHADPDNSGRCIRCQADLGPS